MDISILLKENYAWTLALIKRHYNFSIDFLKNYVRKNHYWWDAKTALEEFVCNENIIWTEEFIKQYCQSINWANAFLNNKSILYSAIRAEMAIDFFKSYISVPIADIPFEAFLNRHNITSFPGLCGMDNFIHFGITNLRKVKEALPNEEFYKLTAYKETWKLIEPLISTDFVEMMIKVEYEFNKDEFRQQSEMAALESDYNDRTYQQMLGEDPSEFTVNTTDFDDETINDAFEGDSDNTWNVD